MIVDIRNYRPEDKEDVLRLLRLNTPEYFSIEEEQGFHDYLEKHAEHYFLLECNNELAACGGINYADDLLGARISWDIVHPSYQGRRIGNKLLQFRVNQIKSVTTIQTITVRTSQLTYGFYEKFGFILKETAKDFWAPGFDLYLMEYPIDR